MGDSFVTTGAMMTCTFGLAPSSLVVLPARTKMLCNVPRANIMDFAPMVNIMPFGMCNTMSNPVVAAATAAKMGVFTPAACIPAVTAPWMPGAPQCLIQGQPALTRNSQCMCMWGGLIRFTTDGQMPGVPPVITPDVSVNVTITQPLTPLEKQQLEPWEQQAYDRELEMAKHAGDGDKAIAADLDRMAEKYEAEGNTAKAKKAREASQAYRENAAKKESAAIEKLNNKYSPCGNKGASVPEEKTTYSKEELQSIRKESDKEFVAKSQKVHELDGEIADNQIKASKQQKDLDKANKKVDEASKPYEEAKSKHNAAEKNKQKADENVEFWKHAEEQSKKEGMSKEAVAFNAEQRRKAESDARKASEEEAAARKDMNKAEKKYNEATKERNKAEKKLEKTNEQVKELKKEQNEARKQRDESLSRSVAAGNALEAQEKKEKHEEAVKRHEEAKKDTREKGQKAAELKKEEDYNRNIADQNFKSAMDAREWGNQNGRDADKGENPFYDMSISETARYDRKADEVAVDRRAADKEYNEAKTNLHNAYEDAYSDDALFDSYTADIDYEQSMAELNKNKK